MSGRIDVKGLDAELRRLYNTLNTGQERTRNLSGPQHFGYRRAEVPRELMAEAIRAYMTDPNYIKAVAPEVAARIRAAVNDNPSLRDTIQFNAGGVPGAGAGRENEQGRIRAAMRRFTPRQASTGTFMKHLLRLSRPER